MKEKLSVSRLTRASLACMVCVCVWGGRRREEEGGEGEGTVKKIHKPALSSCITCNRDDSRSRNNLWIVRFLLANCLIISALISFSGDATNDSLVNVVSTVFLVKRKEQREQKKRNGVSTKNLNATHGRWGGGLLFFRTMFLKSHDLDYTRLPV